MELQFSTLMFMIFCPAMHMFRQVNNPSGQEWDVTNAVHSRSIVPHQEFVKRS